ncbi:MAG: lipoprotein-releasing ABC transporter permease subunit [Alphaproteobacteria bacterium]
MSAATRPFAPFEWKVALRYLRARRHESFIAVISTFSLIGIALGVATLIIVMSVMNGFRNELLGRILGLNGHMVVQSTTGGMPNFDETAARIRAVPGVVSATPIIEGQVMVSASQAAFGALVRGLRPADLQNLTAVSSTLSSGAMQVFRAEPSVILGGRLADKLGVSPGQSVTLIAPRGDFTPFGTTPRLKSYLVAGTFRIGMSEYDQTFIFLPFAEAQLFFNMGETAGGIEVMVANADAVQQWRGPVQRAAGDFARVIDWQQMNSSLFGALQVERNVMFLILMLIILVAALNIISGLIMLVKDKNHDIAILRTMGATPGAVMRVFFIAGASIGLFGTLAGLFIGVVFCENIEAIRQGLSALTGTELFSPEIYFLSKMPAEIETGEVIAVVLMSLALSFLATLYPSWRAARLDPVEALRYE